MLVSAIVGAFILLLSTGAYVVLMLLLGSLLVTGIYLATRNSGGRISTSRRTFFSGGDQAGYAIFFGIQIAIQVFGGDTLRAQLARLIEAEDETDSVQEKRRFIKSVAALLIENKYAWEYGFWEYYTDADTSISSYNQWRNELEASMATEPDEMGSEVDKLSRFSDKKEYLVVTIIMLIDNHHEPVEDDVGDIRFRPTYAQLAAPFRSVAEGFEEKDYWTAETFTSLLEAARALDPRAIERDGIYVYPGTEHDGLSSLDLLGDEGWKYLTDHSFRLK